ncbi:TPA: hypothetical protein ACKP0F_002481 [Stenotrophomonas maltophilia]|nr:hypothetical protein [Stenotrophomonas maltophilia]
MGSTALKRKARRVKKRIQLLLGKILVRLKKSAELLATYRNEKPYPARVPRLSVAFVQSWRVLRGSRTYRHQARFDALTPARLAGRDYERYRAELQRALRLPKVRNIAVTGGYGAGKSSFIQSFASDHDEYNYGFISLAKFNGAGESASSEAGDTHAGTRGGEDSQSRNSAERIEVARVEETIVQQLLYSVKDSSIPQTRLKRINHVSLAKSAIYAGLTAATAIAVFRILGLPKSHQALASEVPIQQILESPLMLSLVFVLVMGMVATTKFLSKVLNFSIHGISIKGLSVAQPAAASVLHKEMDEILYLFERNKIDIVFIEDLDRFSDVGVFTRMREINFMINLSPGIKRPVHFVYLIRDDLFAAEDRVKFFDYVIPIISVINTDNSKQKMLDIICQRRWGQGFAPDESLIEAVSYYVDDMRQLVSILNEYDLFRSVVGGNKYLDRNKTFALVFAKCMFPREYSQLLKGRGGIFDLIFSYVSWSRDREANYTAEIANLEEVIAGQEVGVARTERELGMLLWGAASDQEPDFNLDAITIPTGERLTFSEFIDKESLGELLETGNEISLHFSGRGVRRISGSKILGAGSGSLGARVRSVRHVANGAAQRLSSLRTERSRDRVIALSQAVSHQEFRNFIAIEANAKGLAAIGFLISNGFLGEDYFDYSGFFYEGSISRKDKDLMLRIKAGELLPVDVSIDNSHGVLSRLGPADFRAGRGLIVELVVQLYSHGGESGQFLEKRSAMLADVGSHLNRLDSILQRILSHACVQGFIEDVIEVSPEALVSIIEGSYECSDSPWKEMISAAFISSERGTVSYIGGELAERLEAIIADLTDGQAFANAVKDQDLAKKWLDDNSVWLNRIDGAIDRDAAIALIDMDAVSTNLNNIRVLASSLGLDWGSRVFSISDVRNDKENELCKDLLIIPSRLISAILEQDGVIEDDAEQLLWAFAILGEPIGNNRRDLRRELIRKFSFRIQSLDKVDSQLWLELCTSDRVLPTWGNLKMLVGGLNSDLASTCLAALLAPGPFFDGLVGDIAELKEMDGGAVGALVASLFSVPGQEVAVAKLLGLSGAIILVPRDSVPLIADSLYEKLVESLGAQWSGWLFEKVQSVSFKAAAEYIRVCASCEILQDGAFEVDAVVFLSALSTSSEIEGKNIADKFISRVVVWRREQADQVLNILEPRLATDSDFWISVLMSPGAVALIDRASLEPSLRVLTELIGHSSWIEVKSLLLTASEGALSALGKGGGGVYLDVNDASRKFSEVLYAAAVIRKPLHRKRKIFVQSSARF